MKLDVKAFAVTCGLLWGFGLFLLTWWIIALDGTTEETTFIGRIYRGYSVSPSGSVIGLAWASIDGLIGGAIFAWLYNFVSARMSSAQKKAHRVEPWSHERPLRSHGVEL